MKRLTTTTHRRPGGNARRTIAAYVDAAAFAALDTLVQRGLFVNRSHAIDAAVALLLQKYEEVLNGEEVQRDERQVGIRLPFGR